jgi:hypothetical protein
MPKKKYATLGLYVLALIAGYFIWRIWVPDLPAAIRVSGSGSPVFFIPHSDETSALETARRFVEANGSGTIVWLDCVGHRKCGDIDPNRYFGFCTNRYNAKAMEDYRKMVFKYFEGEPIVIALHNNRGCRGSICLDHPYEGARAIGETGPSDVVIFNGPEEVPSGPRARFSECLAKNNIGQLYEKSGAVSDCSMSEAATVLGHFYFNLDTELSRGTDNQMALLAKTMDCARRAF